MRQQPVSCEMEVMWYISSLQVDAGGCADSGVQVCSSLWLPVRFLLPVRRRQIFGSETTTWTDTVLLRV